MKIPNKPDIGLVQSIVDVIGFLAIAIVHCLIAIYRFFTPKSSKKLKDINGEIALVTGGGGGLGRLLALRLSQLGATVIIWDVNKESVEETVNVVKGIGGTAYGYQCDLADREDVYRVAKKTVSEVGEVTILINNAGVASGRPLLSTPDHLIKRTFDVNIVAHFWTVKAFLPKMMEKNKGHIVTVASMAGLVGISKLVDYCSSKHAAVGFDEALRVELEDQGIKGVKTTCICPYFIQSTGMFGAVNSRFLPRLKSNEVADRIIDGLRRNETLVMIPKVFYLGIVFKHLVPWSVLSMFLRGLVPDASNYQKPTQPTENLTNHNVAENGKMSGKDKVGVLSSSVSQMNHRIAATGKNL